MGSDDTGLASQNPSTTPEPGQQSLSLPEHETYSRTEIPKRHQHLALSLNLKPNPRPPGAGTTFALPSDCVRNEGPSPALYHS